MLIDGYWIWPRSSRWGFRQRQKERAIELGLPIPGTGRRRYSAWLRNPRCHGIYREGGCRGRTAQMEVDGVRVRGKLHHPPNAYDDIPIRARDDRNWKRFKRAQWK